MEAIGGSLPGVIVRAISSVAGRITIDVDQSLAKASGDIVHERASLPINLSLTDFSGAFCMPRAFLVGESAEADGCEPTGPKYLFLDRRSIETYFERWFMDEPYLCISDDGASWRFVVKTDAMVLKIDTVNRYRPMFFDWFRIWLNANSRNNKDRSIDVRCWTDENIDIVLNDKEFLRSIVTA